MGVLEAHGAGGETEATEATEATMPSGEATRPAGQDTAVSLAATAYDPDRPPVPPGADTADSLIGRNIDHFEIRALLGQGGMGTVYLAHDLSLQRPVAIKVLRPELADSPDLVERLMLEARAQARLQHPNVVNVYYIGRFEGTPYFAMEYVRGETLADRLVRQGPLRWEEALEYIIQTARALMEANKRGIVHRDVKPSNLMLSDVGAQNTAIAHIKVADFGLAAPTGVKEAHFVGSPYYASPEQIAGKPPDHRSDIYSLGVSFHELLTGAPPFEAESLRTITKLHEDAPRPAIPARQAPWRLRQLIIEMMDADPTKRPWTYEELLQRLEALRPRELIPGGLVARGMALLMDLGMFAIGALIIAGLLQLGTRTAYEVTFGLFAIYYLVGHRVWSQTLGKRMFRLRIQGTTRAVSVVGLTLRFVVKFWGPIVAMVLVHLQPEATGGADEIRQLKERVNAFIGWEEIPLLDSGAQELLTLLSGANLALAVPWVAGLLTALFDENRRALHDLFARTRVVYAMREQPDNGGRPD